jgi:hypothetical protein
MSKVETKRFPMTIPVELDRRAEVLVQGDSHYKGNRNKFFVDAIARAISSYVTDLSVKLGGETVKPPEVVQVDLQPPEPPPPPQAPEPVVEIVDPMEEMRKELEQVETRGRKPMLEWRDGAIRNATNQAYRVFYGPPIKSHQTKEEHFEQCRSLKGVIFLPVKGDGTKIQVNDIGEFTVVNL